MIFKKKRRSYAVYIQFVDSGKTACHVNYEGDAGRAWLSMFDKIKDNGDQGKIRIIDIKRID